ncbi:hypothetical protein HXX01_04355 [Candidatus Nomurabacteria bacterium]|nr:hypothetical protein [Candidatus Nomurabacteria bacterium]
MKNIFVDYRSKAVWSKKTGELMSLTLSTGEQVMPETAISSIFGLLDFLWKNHRSELTWWGKISYWLNQ